MLSRVFLASCVVLIAAAWPLGVHPVVPTAGALAQSSTGCPERYDVPSGVELSLLACSPGGVSGGGSTRLELKRQRFAPGAAVSPQVAPQDELLYVEQGELVVAEIGRTAGDSVLVQRSETYGLRNDSFDEASLLSLKLVWLQLAGGNPGADLPQVGSADPAGFLLAEWATAPVGQSVMFVARMTLAPGAGVGPVSQLGPDWVRRRNRDAHGRTLRDRVCTGCPLRRTARTDWPGSADVPGKQHVVPGLERRRDAGHGADGRGCSSGSPHVRTVPGNPRVCRQASRPVGRSGLRLRRRGRDPACRPPTSVEWAPAFAHDGGQIAYLSDASGSTQAWVMAPDGSNQRQVTNFPGPGEIRFVAWNEYDDSLWLTVDTGAESFLMRAPVSPDQPEDGWSMPGAFATVAADGNRAFVTQPSGDYGSSTIMFDDVRLGTTSPVASTAFPADAPCLSPDGGWLAYQVGQGGNRHIEVVPLFGGSPRVLTSGGDASNPVWSPDGEAVAYVTTNGRPSIAIQMRDGGPATTLALPDYDSVWYLTWRR